jgi:hypothetical protein
VLQWIFLGLLFLVSFVLPLIWAPYMAAAMRRSSLEIGNRGVRFYANEANLDADRPDSPARTVRTVQVPIFGTVVRTVVLVVVPIVVALIALGFDVQLGSGKLLTAGLLFIAASAVSTLAWIAYRRWRKLPI